jgi:putative metalloenzyme radical SAM/SPASM domain maturase
VIKTSTPDMTMLPYPSKLFVETTTRCNLNCVICVKQAGSCEISEGDMSPETFNALAPAFPHLKALILNGIGEPLLNPHLESYISKAKKCMPREGWVGFQTNGLMLTNLRALSLADAGLDKICISLDALSPKLFSKVRPGGEIGQIHNAFNAVNVAKKQCQRDDLQLGVEFVAMRGNLHELPAALEWSARHGATFAIVTHALPYDNQHLDEMAVGICSDQAIALFKQYKQYAMAEQLDLTTYFVNRFSTYNIRSTQQQRVIDLVDAMKAEAEKQGILIDLKKLLKFNLEQFEELVETFAKVEAVARDNGLDLRLPTVALKEQRKCDFVEEGAAFVSWQGEVSPCYFLWHQYHCYASGWKQKIRPVVFGNATENDILTIWNSSKFSSFRQDVLAYDYPSCASCYLAPCDYVESENFEQDCHIKSVPCGACLWCTGIFQCLR